MKVTDSVHVIKKLLVAGSTAEKKNQCIRKLVSSAVC